MNAFTFDDRPCDFDGSAVRLCGPCAACQTEGPSVARTGPATLVGDRSHVASAKLGCCERKGTLVLWHDTLFGLDEDSAVLDGRPRVYGDQRRGP